MSAMRRLTIALVNNLPDAALHAAERQFRELLSAASHGFDLCLRLFMFPGQVRSDATLAETRAHYRKIDELWSGGPIDGLIVTGTEPRMAIEDEPFWPALTRTLAWAQEHVRSTILSCHAAHAAVFYFDGIRRWPLPRKLSGLCTCVRSADHRLLAGLPESWVTPHSRYNDVPEPALVTHGYSILSRLAETGAIDMFAAKRNSLFLFFQGHLEYDAGALLREYRRDVRRFLYGERDEYPTMPSGYFDAAIATSFERFEKMALSRRDPALLAQFPLAAAERRLAQAWRQPALRLYRNWVDDLAGHSGAAHSTTTSLAAADQR
jgi:homoserine O-succinyltransferase/O-acetyltransferase